MALYIFIYGYIYVWVFFLCVVLFYLWIYFCNIYNIPPQHSITELWWPTATYWTSKLIFLILHWFCVLNSFSCINRAAVLLNIPFFCSGAAASSAVGVTAEPGHAGGEPDYRSDPVPGGRRTSPLPLPYPSWNCLPSGNPLRTQKEEHIITTAWRSEQTNNSCYFSIIKVVTLL